MKMVGYTFFDTDGVEVVEEVGYSDGNILELAKKALLEASKKYVDFSIVTLEYCGDEEIPEELIIVEDTKVVKGLKILLAIIKGLDKKGYE